MWNIFKLVLVSSANRDCKIEITISRLNQSRSEQGRHLLGVVESVIVLVREVDCELVLLGLDQFGHTSEVGNVHGPLDFVFVNVKYLLRGNDNQPILSPLVLINLLDLVTEEDGLYRQGEKFGVNLLFSSSGIILASFATFW